MGATGTVRADGTLAPWVIWDHSQSQFFCNEDRLDFAQPITPNQAETASFMSSVSSTIKRLALKASNPNEVAKRDAGLKDDCGNLTDAGRDALLGILETQVDAQFTQLANDINAENQSNKA